MPRNTRRSNTIDDRLPKGQLWLVRFHPDEIEQWVRHEKRPPQPEDASG